MLFLLTFKAPFFETVANTIAYYMKKQKAPEKLSQASSIIFFTKSFYNNQSFNVD